MYISCVFFIQGFQLIVGVNENEIIESHCPSTATPPPSKVAPQTNKLANLAPTKRYLLSIGRMFHKLTLIGSTITVTRYRPRFVNLRFSCFQATCGFTVLIT